MNISRFPMYAIAAVAGVGIAMWVGLPVTVLFLLICPLMMFFMMRGMGGLGGQPDDQSSSHRPGGTKPDGSHDRIDHP
jgi:hypothetical protein